MTEWIIDPCTVVILDPLAIILLFLLLTAATLSILMGLKMLYNEFYDWYVQHY